MSIIYALVARQTTILAEYSSRTGNFTAVTSKILQRIPQEDSMMSYVYDKYVFHYIVEHRICYMCMADEKFGRRLPFAFLQDIKNRWKASFGDRGQSAPPYAMNEEFKKILRKQMDYYSSDPNADKITRVQGEIEEVKTIMTTNIDTVLKRGEKIELLVDKSEHLSSESMKFKKQSTSLKRAMCWKNGSSSLSCISPS
jgi:vesicle-associated membrane protein 7